MSLTIFKLWTVLLILLTTILGGIWPFLKKKKQMLSANNHAVDFPMGESFASGIFLGAGLLHMLPDSAAAFIKAGHDYPFPYLIATSVFLFLLLLEHVSVSLQHQANKLGPSIVVLSVVMLSVHSLLEGTAVGISNNLAAAVVIFIAIIAHKGAASFALATNLNKSPLSFKVCVLSFIFFALMTPVGILWGNWILFSNHENFLLVPTFSALAAGTFLYIGTLHGLDRASLIKNCCNMREFLFMIAGFMLMASIAIWT